MLLKVSLSQEFTVKKIPVLVALAGWDWVLFLGRMSDLTSRWAYDLVRSATLHSIFTLLFDEDSLLLMVLAPVAL